MMKRGRHAGKSCRVSAAAVKQLHLIVSRRHRPLNVLAIIVFVCIKAIPAILECTEFYRSSSSVVTGTDTLDKL